jgi:hypothetical protein
MDRPQIVELADSHIRTYGHVLLSRQNAETYMAAAPATKIEPDRERPTLLRLSRPPLSLP